MFSFATFAETAFGMIRSIIWNDVSGDDNVWVNIVPDSNVWQEEAISSNSWIEV